MIDWTEEDIEYICTNILQPAFEVTIKGIAEEQDKSDQITDRLLSSIGDAISDIRYEQERDRRFYKAMFTQLLLKNTMLTPAAYDEFYKSWCEEFDKLNKEKKDDTFTTLIK
jgi:hypothetical protein